MYATSARGDSSRRQRNPCQWIAFDSVSEAEFNSVGFRSDARASYYRHRSRLTQVVEPTAPPTPAPALQPEERAQAQTVPHEPRFQDRSPAAVQSTLLDEGLYLCSIPSMYRILEAEGES